MTDRAEEPARPRAASPHTSFRPTATLVALRKRAELLQSLRDSLFRRGYWEAETPILSADTCVDAHLDPPTSVVAGQRMFLQTSPEFGMKRLLAAGSGSIFQISRVFRDGEVGGRHNPEFTLAEWYRVGADDWSLMTEVGEIVTELTGLPTPQRIDYRGAFLRHVGIDPFKVSDAELQALARVEGLTGACEQRDDLLTFLLATKVEPHLGVDSPTFLYDYPASQAALARLGPARSGEGVVARRFELYVAGVELCNGYHELTDADELLDRNRRQNQRRRAAGKEELPTDSRLIDAMRSGLPDCAGVALGFDRLVMIALGAERIDEVIAFPFERA